MRNARCTLQDESLRRRKDLLKAAERLHCLPTLIHLELDHAQPVRRTLESRQVKLETRILVGLTFCCRHCTNHIDNMITQKEWTVMEQVMEKGGDTGIINMEEIRKYRV